MKVAVVGVGYWGRKHVRVLHNLPLVDEVVCVDEHLHESGWPTGTRGYADLDDALPLVDAVIIATPPTSHAALAQRAIAAGKHVLVEKPFTATVTQARETVAAAEAAGVVLMVGHTYIYNGVVQRLRSYVRDHRLGDLYYIDTARLNLGLYRPDVNVVWDLAAHDVAIVNYLLDDVPTVVAARSGHAANPRFDDIAYIWLEYENSHPVVASMHVSWLDPCKVRRITVVGSEAMAVYDDLASEEPLKIYDKGVTFQRGALAGDVPLSYRYGDVTAPYIDVEEPLAVEDRHFVECALTGRRPLTDGRAGLDVVEVLHAIDQSLRTNQIIAMDHLREAAR